MNLVELGFMKDYRVWIYHGEIAIPDGDGNAEYEET